MPKCVFTIVAVTIMPATSMADGGQPSDPMFKAYSIPRVASDQNLDEEAPTV
jgi:hypothetical protein